MGREVSGSLRERHLRATLSLFVNAVLPQSWGSPSISVQGDGFRSKRNHPGAQEFDSALPYICLFNVLSRFTWLSTTPLLHFSVTAASTARMSRRNRQAKFWIKKIPVASARSIQRCKR
jgi:hypothetical protein